MILFDESLRYDRVWRYASLYRKSYRFAERMFRRKSWNSFLDIQRRTGSLKDASTPFYVAVYRLSTQYTGPWPVRDSRGTEMPLWLVAMHKAQDEEVWADRQELVEAHMVRDWRAARKTLRRLRKEFVSSPFGYRSVVGDCDFIFRICATPYEVQTLEYQEGFAGNN